MSTSLISILQNPQAYPLQEILGTKSAYMNKLIDYVSLAPDPFLMNERQCYYYPSKAVQILNTSAVYKHLIVKQDKKSIDGTKLDQNKNQKSQQQILYEYPYLDRLFKNLRSIENQEILLGYVDRVLYSLAKKTPEIYEYFKDNQQSLLLLLKNDHILFAMKDFLILFLTQSTMMLYVFLKNMVLRTLMFRIIESDETSPIVYEMISEFYNQLVKAYLAQKNEDDKEEILQVLKNIEEENFVALLALKISPQHERRTYFIAKILNQIASSPNNVSSLVVPYVDTYTEYMQAYEESENFMLLIMPDQLMMLRLILKICAIEKQALNDVKQESIKRLLVYSNIHEKNAIIHNMFFSLIEVLQEQGNRKILIKAKIIQFLKNNVKSSASFNFKGLAKRICRFFNQKQLDNQIEDDEEVKFIKSYVEQRKQKVLNSKYFKEINNNQSQAIDGNLSSLTQKGQENSANDTKP